MFEKTSTLVKWMSAAIAALILFGCFWMFGTGVRQDGFQTKAEVSGSGKLEEKGITAADTPTEGLNDGLSGNQGGAFGTLLGAVEHRVLEKSIESESSRPNVLDQSELNRLRYLLETENPELMDHAYEVSQLIFACQSLKAATDPKMGGGTVRKESDRVSLDLLLKYCKIDLVSDLDSLGDRFFEYRNQRPESVLADRVVGRGASDENRLSDTEFERMALEVLLNSNDYNVILDVLGAYSFDKTNRFRPRVRPFFLENLPGMGSILDYRSSRFLMIVGYSLVCQERPRLCGPESLLALAMCRPLGLCVRGVSVGDVLNATYSQREIYAASVAAARIAEARRARRRG